MKKLELKHLVGYLPYKLKGVLSHPDIKNTSERFLTGRLLDYLTEYNCYVFKPILRPLSDIDNLTVDFSGHKDKFINRYFGFNSMMHYHKEYLKYGSAYWNNRAPYCVVQWLFEYHFDIHGLIDAGLAIDINTIKE